jgi:hypothetical protein
METKEILPFFVRRAIEQAKELGARHLKTTSKTSIRFIIEDVEYVAWQGLSGFMIYQNLETKQSSGDLECLQSTIY